MRRNIGAFLCRHDDAPRWERTDRVTKYDLDVRQDAALRAWYVLVQRNVIVDDIEQALTVHGDIANQMLHYAWVENMRRRFGRKGEKRHVRGVDDEVLAVVRALEEESEQEQYLERINEDAAGELRRLINTATPAQREAIALMMDLLVRKQRGQSCSSNAIRSKLRRLRRRTGWPLDVSLL